jgi:hypothetical protein
VGSRVNETTADFLERAMTAGLPISTHVERLTLLVEDDDGMWSIRTSWALRDATNE